VSDVEHRPTEPNQRRLIDAAWRQIERCHSSTNGGATRPAGIGIGRSQARITQTDLVPGCRIEREIQRGGQGIVFEGVQLSTRRTVAIKLLRDGPFAGPRELARFEREVQVLAQLRHPNIVTIHDSGRVPGGAYFVMDYIPGAHLDHYVTRTRLTIEARLRLFVKIADAVSKAHLHGVIHRDLKPSNIRVDAQGEPHVLDFGLAKLTGVDERTPDSDADLTMTGQFVGSLPWASPEQAEGRTDAVDLRTDVYSLGVMLYQLLTGHFPYDVSGSHRAAANNIVQVEPRNPRAYNRVLDDEIIAIVLKALRKDPDLRYQSAGELGRDVARYLAGEPIDAKRDSALYLIRKYVARHGVTAGIVAAFVLLVVAGLAVSLTFWQQAERARRDEAVQHQLADASAARAREEAARATATARFLERMLTAADPAGDGGPDVTVRETLDQAADDLANGTLADQPQVEASTRATIGRVYLHLGLLEKAREHLTVALGLHEAEHGRRSAPVASDLNNLGMLARAAGELEAAERHYRAALDIQASLEHVDVEVHENLLNNLALVLANLGSYEEAERLYEQVVANSRARGERGPALATTLNNLALLRRGMHDEEAAEALFREALEILREAYGNEHPRVAACLESLGGVYLSRGEFARAEPMYREALAVRQRVFSGDHPDVATGLNNLGYLLFTKGDLDAAEPYYREALEMRRRLFGDDHPSIARALNNLGLLFQRRGDSSTAEPLYREALELKRRALGERDPSTLLQMGNLAALLRDSGRLDEAEQLSARATQLYEEVLPAGHPRTAQLRGGWGLCLLRLGRYEEAEAQLLASYTTLTDTLGTEHAAPRRVAETLLELYKETGDEAAANAWREKQPAAASSPAPAGP
jgi:tetratricopeptide (TPR) repeat protein